MWLSEAMDGGEPQEGLSLSLCEVSRCCFCMDQRQSPRPPLANFKKTPPRRTQRRHRRRFRRLSMRRLHPLIPRITPLGPGRTLVRTTHPEPIERGNTPTTNNKANTIAQRTCDLVIFFSASPVEVIPLSYSFSNRSDPVKGDTFSLQKRKDLLF